MAEILDFSTMPAINLVPPELKPKRSILALASLLKRVVIVGLTAFLVSIAVAVSGFLLVSRQLSNAISHKEELKTSIEALEETEKRLVLVQDRLDRANKILAFPTSVEEIRILESVVQAMPEALSFTKAELTPAKTQVAILAGDSSSLSKFFASVQALQTFKQIELTSFNYSSGGYAVELAFIK